ncbi:MAG: arginase family protein [Candidatus Calescibacterium sp.]|nr:arginase family protein [Candidatus Calescibacterium sp.]MDW8132302.1 arginase family protein [Candidatus Calescibacterium sp.]
MIDYFESEPVFLRDPLNFKLKDIVLRKENYDLLSLEGLSEKYRDIVGSEPTGLNVLVPIPWDGSTAGRPGARFSPQRIIDKFLSLSFNHHYRNLVVIMPYVRTVIGDKKKTFRNISMAISRILSFENKNLPFYIGGDHSISFPIIEQYLCKFGKVNLLVFDSHFDLREVSQGLSGGTYLRELKEKYKDKLNVIILGIKDLANPYYLYLQAQKYNVKYLNNIDILLDIGKAIEFLRIELDKNLPVYISIDLDSIDVNYVDSVNSPNSFGFSLKEIYTIIEYVKNNYHVIGFDIVEFNPLVGNLDRSLLNVSELLFYISKD